MNINYRKYEPNQGLEEIQAEIWLNAQQRFGDSYYSLPSLDRVIQQIKTRNETDKPDENGMLYAFTEDGKPLAYVQSHMASRFNATEISFPWAVEDCPREVQDKLFNKIFNYISERDKNMGDDHQIIVGGGIRADWKHGTEFLKSHGFEPTTTYLTYKYNIESFELEDKEKFTLKKGDLTNEQDLTSLMDLGMVDETALLAFGNEETLKNYYKRIQEFPLKVLLIFEKDLIVAAGAVRIEENRDPTVQFTFYRPGHEPAWHLLMIKISKMAFDKTQRSLLCTYEDGPTKEFEMVRDLEKAGHAESVSKSYRFTFSKS
ncbi:MAG: hypothetical protein JSV04_08365 [Candidatus Heimdallarchaeota archaeon]|nr:MAG: hypothetical protein JSV04_08365 [Candidatus Heimdallarchaeota archaeon]